MQDKDEDENKDVDKDEAKRYTLLPHISAHEIIHCAFSGTAALPARCRSELQYR